MNPEAICQQDESLLVIVDVQEKLCSVMAPEALQTMVKNCGILLQAARLLDIPRFYTEQYPKGLGSTVPELMALLPASGRVEKTVFSCSKAPAFCRKLTTDKPQVILAPAWKPISASCKALWACSRSGGRCSSRKMPCCRATRPTRPTHCIECGRPASSSAIPNPSSLNGSKSLRVMRSSRLAA